MDEKTDCYKCAHRGILPGDAHSKCCHPEAEKGLDPDNIAAMAEAFMGKANAAKVILGVRGGGQTWPANFNPAFLTACRGFTLKVQWTRQIESRSFRGTASTKRG